MTILDDVYVKTVRELAKALGRSMPTIYGYKREKGLEIPKTIDGYNVSAVARWISKNVRQKSDMKPLPCGNGRESSEIDENSEDYHELYVKERALKTQAQREREQLKHEVESGQYIPLEDVKERDIARIAAVKSGLMSLPRRLAQELCGLTMNQIEVTLKTRFRELLEKFARM